MLNPSPLYKCDLEMKFFKFFLFVARLALVAFNKGKSLPVLKWKLIPFNTGTTYVQLNLVILPSLIE
jgi:hypothetical protein